MVLTEARQAIMQLEKISWIAGIVSAVLAGVGLFVSLPLTKDSEERPTIDSVLKKVKLGTDISYLDFIAGPAFRTDEYEDIYYKYYIINGCNLSVTSNKNKKVDEIKVYISEKCSISWEAIDFNMYKLPAFEKLRFGDIMDEFIWSVSASCLLGCGNAAASEIEIRVGGSRADHGVITVFGAFYDDSENGKNFENLIDKIEKQKGERFLIDRLYECNYDFINAASTTARRMRPTYIVKRYAKENEAFPGYNNKCK